MESDRGWSRRRSAARPAREKGEDMGRHGIVVICAGIGWTLLFAAMSFYWASGGMIGVESLGGAIYEKAMERDPEFAAVVWATGFVKLAGAIPLILLLRNGPGGSFRRLLARFCMVVGALLFLYGLANFVTISLAGMNVLDFDLSRYALVWRLVFWEPFWMAGGWLYFAAGRAGLRRVIAGDRTGGAD